MKLTSLFRSFFTKSLGVFNNGKTYSIKRVGRNSGRKMSLRQAIRSKFRAEKTDSDRENESQSSTNAYRGFQEDEMCLAHDDTGSGDEFQYCSSEKQCIPDGCHLMFESQLNQLQEQLVATMLENQQLSNELKILRDQLNVDQLLKQLEKEREKTKQLTEKLQEKESKEKEPPVGSKSPRLRRLVRREKNTEKSRPLDVNQPTTSSTNPSPSSSISSVPAGPNLTPPTPEREEWLDIPCREDPTIKDEIACLECNTSHFGPFLHPPKLPVGWRQRLWTWAHDLVLELVEDFTDTTVEAEESVPDEDREGDPLTVRKLKENMIRFGNATKPISNGMELLNSLLRWKSPGSTFLALFIYMYTVYHGWFLPLLLFYITCQLLLNYFRHRGWFSIFSVSKKTEPEESDKDMGVSDKFQLVLHVARKVQNQLGHIADCFEKLKNLFLWQQPEVTAHLFFAIFAMFLASCIFPANQLFTAGGLYLGLKCFLVDYVFYLFPRVRQKHDATLRMWLALPTDQQLEKRHNKLEIDRNLLIQGTGISLTGSQHSLTAENQFFCDLFNLPPSETPLLSWHGGRRCTLINKDKSLTSAFKNGRLYLTNSFLCFERSKTANLKNLVLPLKNIKQVERSKPYPWMPGGGMALEVTLEKPEKTYIFGAILNRDETFESIMEAGRKAGLHWANAPIAPPLPPPTVTETSAEESPTIKKAT